MTITEALAEIKTIGKRIEKKRQNIQQYLARQDVIRDPLEKDGGSRAVIVRERQAIGDLQERIVGLRKAIAHANATTPVEIDGLSRSIAEWLTWRREVAPTEKSFLQGVQNGLASMRKEAGQKQLTVKPVPERGGEPTDILVNIDESQLSKDIEHIETVLGTLDGRLSLLNATTFVKA